MLDLMWMRELIAELPKIQPQRENMISVAGYPNWETVVSNYLAFYLDCTNDHNFDRLFINSLLDAYNERKGKYTDNSCLSIDDTEFKVEREYPTAKGGRIDIVVMENSQSSDDIDKDLNDITNEHINNASWSVIIENKLYSGVTNDLTDYWTSVKANSKIAILLTLEPTESPNKHFVNITHKTLIEYVLRNMSEYYINADDRHLLFLKEYIMSLESHYTSNKTMAEEKTLHLFRENMEAINAFKDLDKRLLIYVSNSLFSVMRSIGFPPSTGKNTSLAKLFYVTESLGDLSDTLQTNIKAAKMFRFWFYVADLRFQKLKGHFELWSPKYTTYGNDLRESLKNFDYTSSVKLGSRGAAGKGYFHIYDIEIDMTSAESNTIEAQIRKAMEENRIQAYIEKAVTSLSALIKS